MELLPTVLIDFITKSDKLIPSNFEDKEVFIICSNSLSSRDIVLASFSKILHACFTPFSIPSTTFVG